LCPELVAAYGFLGQDAVMQVIAVFYNGWLPRLVQLDLMVVFIEQFIW
jgi:hypothetical protein